MKKRRIVSLLLAAAILAAALTGCANLKVGLMLLQHATGPYDPMDQVMEDRLNAILEAAVAQDAAFCFTYAETLEAFEELDNGGGHTYNGPVENLIDSLLGDESA